jgi:hypothetical protein
MTVQRTPLSYVTSVSAEEIRAGAARATILVSDANDLSSMQQHLNALTKRPAWEKIVSSPHGSLCSQALECIARLDGLVSSGEPNLTAAFNIQSALSTLNQPITDELGGLADSRWFASTDLAGMDVVWTRTLLERVLQNARGSIADDPELAPLLPKIERALDETLEPSRTAAKRLRDVLRGPTVLGDVLQPDSSLRKLLPKNGWCSLLEALEHARRGLPPAGEGDTSVRNALDRAIISLQIQGENDTVSPCGPRHLAALEGFAVECHGALPALVGQLVDAYRFAQKDGTAAVERRFKHDGYLRRGLDAERGQAWLETLPIGMHVVLEHRTGLEEGRRGVLWFYEKTPEGLRGVSAFHRITIGWKTAGPWQPIAVPKDAPLLLEALPEGDDIYPALRYVNRGAQDALLVATPPVLDCPSQFWLIANDPSRK